MDQKQSSFVCRCFTGAARLASIALLVLFLSFLFGEEPLPKFLQEPLSVQLIFLGWAATFLGYFVAWRFPIVGGLLVFSAIGFMYCSEYVINNRVLGPAFLLWLIPGALFLMSGWTCARRPAVISMKN